MDPSKTLARRLWETHDLHLALLVGLLARVLILVFYPAQNFPDTSTYVRAGRELFLSGTIGSHVVMPLYPIMAYLTGGGVWLQLLDVALSVTTIWLVYGLSLELFGHRGAALLAAYATALYPFFVFYAVNKLTETSCLFLLVAVFLLLQRRRYLAGAVVLVISILLRPTIDLLAPLLVVCFSALVHRSPWKTTLKRLAIYLAVYFILMSGWWFHNYQKYGRFVRLNLGDGIVLYSGNNPLNRSGGGIAGVDVDLAVFDHIRDPIERNAAMKQAAIRYIREDPGWFARMGAVKFLRFWRLWPYAEEYGASLYLAVSLLSYGPVLVLSVLFFLLHGRRMFHLILPYAMFIAYLTAVHMTTIGSIRYRLPVEPFLIVFAAYTVGRWLESPRQGRSPPNRWRCAAGEAASENRGEETGIGQCAESWVSGISGLAGATTPRKSWTA